METREVVSFCRICPASCGLRMTLDDNGTIIRIGGDKEHPLSQGYVCFKGLQAEEMHHGPTRLLHPLKKMPDGSYVKIRLEQALDEISAKLQQIIDHNGADAVGGFMGNGAIYNAVSHAVFPQWMKSINSNNYFTAMTIDQPAKMVTPLRLGLWGAGKQLIPDSETLMIIGSNGLVSHSTNHGLVSSPTKTIKKEKQRGLKIIIIDPRMTETARYADVFLQPYPGEDPTLLAGLLSIILENNWHDKEFCSAYIAPGELEKLCNAIKVFDLSYVSERTGVAKEKIIEAATVFAKESKTGPVLNSTGASMSPRGNLSDHLVEVINVVCGRFRRAGERYQDISLWMPNYPRHAEVIPPDRSWEKEPESRIFGATSLMGERMSSTLADQILTPSVESDKTLDNTQIKALINASGNPAISMPDKKKFAKAMDSLELLVTIDPFMTATAQHSDYILPTKMMYERHDLPLSFMGIPIQIQPWAQYAKPIMHPPKDSEVVDDWVIYWGIAKRLGKTLTLNGIELDMENPPTTEAIIEILTKESAVPLEDIKKYPSGKVFDIAPQHVKPARPEANGKFDVIPEDIKLELAQVRQQTIKHGHYESNGQIFSHRLSVRRRRNVVNTIVHQLETTKKKYGRNPVWINSADLNALGLNSGDKVNIISDHGSVAAIVEADDSMRSGVVSMCHGYGGRDHDADVSEEGSSVNLLINSSRNLENITAMVRMSSIPVNIEKCL